VGRRTHGLPERIIQLEHQQDGAKATTAGLLMFDAALGAPVYSVDNAWVPLNGGGGSGLPIDWGLITDAASSTLDFGTIV
jgi:hypothetical protein